VIKREKEALFTYERMAKNLVNTRENAIIRGSVEPVFSRM